ncbi:MAG: carboxy-S-adenosyl-L-methionine synthase CmoA [Bdellovibrio sp.]
MSKKDNIFNKERQSIEPFSFNQEVAEVFDDMVSRSVPFYAEIHRLITDLSLNVLKNHAIVVDLGCSTGETLCLLKEKISDIKQFQGIGIDNSKPMIEKAKEKAKTKNQTDLTFEVQDILDYSIPNCDMIIMNYTLQFISPNYRDELLKNIYRALNPGGILILSEKICSPQSQIQNLITELYYDFKRRNGYSELEISQKREALENVLVPITPEEQMGSLKRAGFEKSEMIFRWYNFASYIGWK